jgi:hypothetical protein
LSLIAAADNRQSLFRGPATIVEDALPDPDRGRHAFGRSLIVLSLLLSGVPNPGRADVRVVGTIDNIRVTTDKDSISDVLAALGATFNIRFRNVTRPESTAAPSYSGSLSQVVARLLDRYNYVIRKERDGFEVIVIGNKSSQASPAGAAPPASDKSFIAPWK